MRISDWSSDVCSSDLVGGVDAELLVGVVERADGVSHEHGPGDASRVEVGAIAAGRDVAAGELLVERGHVLGAPFPSQLASQPWVLMMVFVRSDSSNGASPSSDRLQISSRRIRSASSWSPSAFMTCARHRRVLSPSGSARLAT